MALLGERHVDLGEGGDVTWVNTHCPLAPWRHERGTDRTPSFGIKIEPGESRIWCFSCHFGGTQTTLLIELSRLLRGEVHTLDIRAAMSAIAKVEAGDEDRPLFPDEDEGPKADVVFPEEWLARFQPAYGGNNLHSYLARRGVPLGVAQALDLRYMHSEDRVCFPIRNWTGELVGLHGRAILDAVQPRYRMITHQGRKNPLAWLGESWIDVDETVVFTESVFDLARVLQVYRNVACPLTSSLSIKKIQRMGRCSRIVTMFDPDQAGYLARRKIERVLGEQCAVTHIDLLDRDPGDMHAGEVAQVLESLVDLDVDLY